MSASQSGSTMNRSSNGFSKASSKWLQDTAFEQGTMQQMAEATGGKSFYNTNGLKEAVGKAIEAGSNYYTIAYTPANRDWNGNFRKIQIRVNRRGLTLAYRRGYFADDPNKATPNNESPSALTGATQYSAIRSSMLHGAPDPTELIFVADVRPSSSETETSPAPRNQASKKLSGPFRRYAVNFRVNPKQLSCAIGPDEAHSCALAFLTYVYDGDGTAINMQTDALTIKIAPDRFASTMSRIFTCRQEISVPVKGEYYLRIGLRDRNSDKVGALEVAVATVAKLPPAAATGAPTGKAESK
jgi:hypothetical protein